MSSFLIPPPGYRTLEYYHVDAFAKEPFTGNPAGVVLGAEGLPNSILQSIAAENNLSETAFLLWEGEGVRPEVYATGSAASVISPGTSLFSPVTLKTPWRMRWFTPTVEIDLCGHATLAAGYVMIERAKTEGKRLPAVAFDTRSGILSVQEVPGSTSGPDLKMRFPIIELTRPADAVELSWLSEVLGCPVTEAYTCGETSTEIDLGSDVEEGEKEAEAVSTTEGTASIHKRDVVNRHPHKGKWMAVLESAELVRSLNPDMKALALAVSHSLIVTAPGDDAASIDRSEGKGTTAAGTGASPEFTTTTREMIPPGELPRAEEGASAPFPTGETRAGEEPGGSAFASTRPDFVSRFFAPAMGIPEDPVTGSAHCALVPYWSRRLGRNTLVARQLSSRGGTLWCILEGHHVMICGTARLYSHGRLLVPEVPTAGAS